MPAVQSMPADRWPQSRRSHRERTMACFTTRVAALAFTSCLATTGFAADPALRPGAKRFVQAPSDHTRPAGDLTAAESSAILEVWREMNAPERQRAFQQCAKSASLEAE